jgi:hypothetical protein
MRLGSLDTTGLWDAVRAHPFLLASGIYIGMATEQWLQYFLGPVLLERVVFFTLAAPLVLLCVHQIRESKHHMTLERAVVAIGGSLALGWPIWVFLNYLLYVPTWALLHGTDSPLSTIAFVLSTMLSCGGVAYAIDRLAKRRANSESIDQTTE